MKKFFRKYWAHIINIMFFISFMIGFILLFNSKISEKFGMLFVIITLLYVGIIWFEIIWHIVVAAKDKNDNNHVLHAVLCYLFSLFYIPCYRLKYVVKDEKYKVKNIIYLVTSIILFIVMYVVIFIAAFINGYNNNKANSYDYNSNKNDSIYEKLPTIHYLDNGKATIFLPNGYRTDDTTNYDFYAIDGNKVLGIFIYDNYEATSDELLANSAKNIMSFREEMTLLDNYDYEVNAKTIKSNVYQGKYDGIKFVYVLYKSLCDCVRQ